MESDHTDQWEILSDSSNTSSFHVTSPPLALIRNNDNGESKDKDDGDQSVHSIQPLESSITSTTTTSSSIVNVNVNQSASHEPSTLIPQIVEHKQMNTNPDNNQNELIPSYVDIESELQRQRELINELKAELNTVTDERDQVCVYCLNGKL